MERLIEFLGDSFFKAGLVYEDFFEEKIKKNDTTMIAFLMILLLLFATFLASVNGFILFRISNLALNFKTIMMFLLCFQF